MTGIREIEIVRKNEMKMEITGEMEMGKVKTEVAEGIQRKRDKEMW